MRSLILVAGLVSCSSSTAPHPPPTVGVVPAESTSAMAVSSSDSAVPSVADDTERIPREEDFEEEARQQINVENVGAEVEKIEREVKAAEP